MRKFLLIVIVLIPISCFAQKTTQENDDSLHLKKQLFLLSNPNSSDQSGDGMFLNRDRAEFNHTSNFKISESNYLPLLSLYQQDRFTGKFLLDMNMTNHFVINDLTGITTTHVQSNFIGLGGLNLVQGQYDFSLGEFGVLSAGIYAAKFNIYNDFLNDGGVTGAFKIKLSDRLNINLFGQYSITGSKIAISPFISPLYPHSDFGGSMEFKVNDNWGLIMGAENEYDVFLRKWVTRPFIMPVFYK